MPATACAAASDAVSPTTRQPAVRNLLSPIPSDHPHSQALLDNAMRYLAPQSGTTEATSGYPVEGWNNEPQRGLGLRAFTQLTAIGEWIEVLANIAAGHVETAYVSRDRAVADLERIVNSLCRDQRDPDVSAMGLLGNFLDLEPGKRQGPLASTVARHRFVEAFGNEKAGAIWQALATKGWILAPKNASEAEIVRKTAYGAAFFDGPLAPFADAATKSRIMAILDHRVVTVVFGDNANLSSSIGRAIGALLAPPNHEEPAIRELRERMEQFLNDQRAGYTHLYDPEVGLFYFGWDAARGRFLGWQDGEGNWRAGHMDYLVNEFRNPAVFVVLRYGLPTDALANLGFKMKPYRGEDGEDVYVPAPWEGSAFQALGLGLCAGEWGSRSWRTLLEQFVEVEIDFARRNGLPGFLSESYTGKGPQYTGDIGIPDIAVTTMPRVTHVASLYTLGVAYTLAPAKVEQFLADHWSIISTLLTDHGPWEGYDAAKQEPIRIQTTAHTLSLVLGLLGSGPQHTMRYLDSRGLRDRMLAIFQTGEKVDFLSDEIQGFAWGNQGSAVTSTRQRGVFRIQGERVNRVGIAMVSPRQQGVNLSDGLLSIRYRSGEPLQRAVIALKPAKKPAADSPIIPKELFVRISPTEDREEEIRITLPATPGLAAVKEVVLECEPAKQDGAIDLVFSRFEFSPYGE